MEFSNLNVAYIYLLKDVLENYDEENIVYNESEINRRPKYEKHNVCFKILYPTLDILTTKSQIRNHQIEKYFKIEKNLFDQGDCRTLTKYGNIWKQITES